MQLSPPTLRVKKVLFIDDESMLVELAGAMLAALGYQGAAYARADEALTAFRDHPDAYLAAFTDLTMPMTSGYEVVRELLLIRADLPVFLMSGNVGHDERQAALKLGVREVLVKPISLDHLRDLLASVA